MMREQLFDKWQLRAAIVNCLYGVQLPHDEHLAAALATAVNDWMAAEWLDPEPRLRASILVSPQNPHLAAEEIERRAADKRFVQVLLLVMGDMPLGNRFYWPIYEAAERHGLPVGIHAGSNYRRPATALGWSSYWAEDYIDQPQAFQGQLSSLISHGVFDKFPGLKVVLIESGVSWLPVYIWRFSKSWRGCRIEVPWVTRDPLEIVRDQVRLTMQPIDAPDDLDIVGKIVNQLGSDRMLLFSSDYPHWQFEGDRVLPEGLPAGMLNRVLFENALETYPRLGDVT
jgi:predicted TIM-barrel fold metal-dependent hydrolase